MHRRITKALYQSGKSSPLLLLALLLQINFAAAAGSKPLPIDKALDIEKQRYPILSSQLSALQQTEQISAQSTECNFFGANFFGANLESDEKYPAPESIASLGATGPGSEPAGGRLIAVGSSGLAPSNSVPGDDSRERLKDSNSVEQAESKSKENAEGAILENLVSQEAMEIARILAIENEIRSVMSLQDIANRLSVTETLSDDLQRRADQLSLKVSKRVLKATLEADCVLSEIAEELAHDELALSQLTQRQAKQLKNASRLDAVANAALWSISSALAIQGYKQPRLSIPAGTMGVLAGAIPSGLELAALQRPVNTRISSTGGAGMLSFIFRMSQDSDYLFPESVHKYLVSVPPASQSGINRCKELIRCWEETALIPPVGSKQRARVLSAITAVSPRYGHSSASKKTHHSDSISLNQLKTGKPEVIIVTPVLLQNKIMMLNQMRATVYRMKRGLYEIMTVL